MEISLLLNVNNPSGPCSSVQCAMHNEYFSFVPCFCCCCLLLRAATAVAAAFGLLLSVMSVSSGLNVLQVSRVSQTLGLSYPVAVQVAAAAGSFFCCCCALYCCCCALAAAVFPSTTYDTLTLTSGNADYNKTTEWNGLCFRAAVHIQLSCY